MYACVLSAVAAGTCEASQSAYEEHRAELQEQMNNSMSRRHGEQLSALPSGEEGATDSLLHKRAASFQTHAREHHVAVDKVDEEEHEPACVEDMGPPEENRPSICCGSKAWLYPELPWGAPPEWDKQYMHGVRLPSSFEFAVCAKAARSSALHTFVPACTALTHCTMAGDIPGDLGGGHIPVLPLRSVFCALQRA